MFRVFGEELGGATASVAVFVALSDEGLVTPVGIAFSPEPVDGKHLVFATTLNNVLNYFSDFSHGLVSDAGGAGYVEGLEERLQRIREAGTEEEYGKALEGFFSSIEPIPEGEAVEHVDRVAKMSLLLGLVVKEVLAGLVARAIEEVP